jgi:ABC-2 type transport system permease protein
MYLLIAKQFIRSKVVQLSLLLLLALGIMSVLIGKQFLQKQERTLANVTQHQQAHIARNVELHREIGLLLYYLRFTLIDKPDRIAGLSIGQRDVNPSVQSITIRTLEAQLHDTDLNNPSNLQSGNLDLGFVIIYLFPLVVIAFLFNLLSEEKEAGTWRLIAVQSNSTLRFLWMKLSVRMLLTYCMLGGILLFAYLILSLPVNRQLITFILVAILYTTFWFAFCFWVVSFQQNSSFNALTLLSAWLILAVLLPASVNNYVANLYPVPESLAAMVKQREGYHEKWDTDKKITMDKFYTHYPQFKKYGVPQETFNWTWYYAMQQMGDDESLKERMAMRAKIKQRENASRWLATVIPTMHTQLLFNDIARTSLSSHLQLLDQTIEFHERLRLYFYPKIFENAPVKSEDWKKFKPEYTRAENNINIMFALLPLFLLTFGLASWGVFNFRKTNDA